MLFNILCFPAAVQAAPSCFTPEEAQAAHLRTLQQEFNVAALNCRSIDPNDPSIAARYNVFISQFDAPMQANARSLRNHFRRTGGSLDIWMTRVANDAGQRVLSDPEFCQRASDILDKVLADPAKVDELATSTATYRIDVPVCDRTRTVVAQADRPKHSGKAKAKKSRAKSKPAPAKSAQTKEQHAGTAPASTTAVASKEH